MEKEAVRRGDFPSTKEIGKLVFLARSLLKHIKEVHECGMCGCCPGVTGKRTDARDGQGVGIGNQVDPVHPVVGVVMRPGITDATYPQIQRYTAATEDQVASHAGTAVSERSRKHVCPAAVAVEIEADKVSTVLLNDDALQLVLPADG